MSSSTPAPRFLLDENVRAEMDTFLKGKGYFAKRLGKGAPDRSLALISREEKLVLVTNDEDFASVPAAKVYAVVLLRTPQRDVVALLKAFETLIAECRTWKGHLIVLQATQWRVTFLDRKRSERRRAA